MSSPFTAGLPFITTLLEELELVEVLGWEGDAVCRGFASGLGFTATGGFGLLGIDPFTLPLLRTGVLVVLVCVETAGEVDFPVTGGFLRR